MHRSFEIDYSVNGQLSSAATLSDWNIACHVNLNFSEFFFFKSSDNATKGWYGMAFVKMCKNQDIILHTKLSSYCTISTLNYPQYQAWLSA